VLGFFSSFFLKLKPFSISIIFERRIWAAFKFPWRTALIKGVSPCLLGSFGLAPSKEGFYNFSSETNNSFFLYCKRKKLTENEIERMPLSIKAPMSSALSNPGLDKSYIERTDISIIHFLCFSHFFLLVDGSIWLDWIKSGMIKWLKLDKLPREGKYFLVRFYDWC
jgi:hypothetical protein